MPLYDYDCAACGRRFEVIHGVHEAPPAACPLCGSGPVRKAFAPPAIHFKGSGWAKKERRAAVKTGTSSKDGEKGSEGDGSSKASDTPSTSTGDSAATSGSTSESSPASTSRPASTSSPASD